MVMIPDMISEDQWNHSYDSYHFKSWLWFQTWFQKTNEIIAMIPTTLNHGYDSRHDLTFPVEIIVMIIITIYHNHDPRYDFKRPLRIVVMIKWTETIVVWCLGCWSNHNMIQIGQIHHHMNHRLWFTRLNSCVKTLRGGTYCQRTCWHYNLKLW